MLVSLIAAAALAQTPNLPPVRRCPNNQEAIACAARYEESLLAYFGMAPAEAEQKTGAEVFRVFFFNGEDQPLPPISFERRPGQDPRAVLYSPGARMEGPVTTESWRAVVFHSRLADRDLVELPKDPTAFPNMCLHPWGAKVELINTSSEHQPIRTRSEHRCDSGLTMQYSVQLAELAIKSLPACQVLKSERYRNDMTRLQACGELRGDRMAAAELANQIGTYANIRKDIAPVEAWRQWMGFSARPKLTWAGQTARVTEPGGLDVARFLASQQEATELNVYPRVFEGLDSLHVRVTGEISLRAKGGVISRAPMEQVWKRDGSGWVLESWTVGAFAF